MKWVADPTGRFDQRPFYEGAEIDNECEAMIDECLEKRDKPSFSPPLDTDTLSVLLEMHASGGVNLFADLVATEGPGVEGVTEFRKGQRPRISIDKRLSEKTTAVNRLRSTMAHEVFHARFHWVLWEMHWSGQGGNVRCMDGQAVFNVKTDWYEWQAAYGSGAILVPRLALQNMIGKAAQIPEFSDEGRALTAHVASSFLVSTEAARVRLVQLNFLLSQRPPVNQG